jgi:hypothetical protein
MGEVVGNVGKFGATFRGGARTKPNDSYARQSVFQSWLPTARGLPARRRRPSRSFLSDYGAVSKLPERKFYLLSQRPNFVAPSSWLISSSPRLVNGQNPGDILRALATDCVQNTKKNAFGPKKTRFKKSLIITFNAEINRNPTLGLSVPCAQPERVPQTLKILK